MKDLCPKREKNLTAILIASFKIILRYSAIQYHLEFCTFSERDWRL